ncbi:aspartate/glutamate racemase family protein [Maribacter sp. HTCC2170]|uniref:aspartate/glutamate racemase family protein n=1 Tax=Maribacter sp. (strain HTCC2170 / KCCM 42371) TaxID=313603 RepID=UPI00006AFC67|nr:aspartate/glutamate racemase family protein [Maribacter sp. HTCC2170]EAR01235.1 Asp/Glu racemase:Aspartate racemase [Maribacter sp. HTCC2170]
MKKIGLIGGITWQSTLLYYQYLNEGTAKALGGKHSSKCLIESVDFADISLKQEKSQWDLLNQDFAEMANKLEQAGAEVLLICANTMHLCADAIKEKVTIPLLHIADVCGEEITSKGCKKVLLLGTKYTMELDFYKDILKNQYGIEVMIPSKEDREVVHDVIYTELAKGIISEDSKKQYKDIIKKSEEEGVEAVILGCTEIPLLIQQEDCSIPVIDTTKIHAEAAVKFATEQ